MNYITKNAIESLNKKLQLPKFGPYSQDWEYELADSSRVNEFISFYESAELSQDEKFALMSLIVSSFDDAISEGKNQEETWERIKKHLIQDLVVHRQTILYWSIAEEELNEFDNGFCITPYMRQINFY